jgi:hypothetical protein
VAGHPEWGHGGPHDAGHYNSKSWETGFFVSTRSALTHTVHSLRRVLSMLYAYWTAPTPRPLAPLGKAPRLNPRQLQRRLVRTGSMIPCLGATCLTCTQAAADTHNFSLLRDHLV